MTHPRKPAAIPRRKVLELVRMVKHNIHNFDIPTILPRKEIGVWSGGYVTGISFAITELERLLKPTNKSPRRTESGKN